MQWVAHLRINSAASGLFVHCGAILLGERLLSIVRGSQDQDSGLESDGIQHILNKPDRIRTTVLFKFPDEDQEFQISLFWDLTPTQS